MYSFEPFCTKAPVKCCSREEVTPPRCSGENMLIQLNILWNTGKAATCTVQAGGSSGNVSGCILYTSINQQLSATNILLPLKYTSKPEAVSKETCLPCLPCTLIYLNNWSITGGSTFIKQTTHMGFFNLKLFYLQNAELNMASVRRWFCFIIGN